jgi:hypothetical protein
VIEGHVKLLSRPLDLANVTLYSSANKKAWVGRTDKDGKFRTGVLLPDRYRIDIAGWGNTLVRLIPETNKPKTGFGATYWLDLLSPTCVGVGEAGN